MKFWHIAAPPAPHGQSCMGSSSSRISSSSTRQLCRSSTFGILVWTLAGVLIAGTSKTLMFLISGEFPALQFMFGWFFAGLGLEITGKLVESQGMAKFGLQEILRLRLSSTTGNLAQLGMRIETKCSFVEARSMSAMGRAADVWRVFRQEFTEVAWVSLESGRSHMKEIIQEFVMTKFSKGMPAFPENEIAGLINDIMGRDRDHRSQAQAERECQARGFHEGYRCEYPAGPEGGDPLRRQRSGHLECLSSSGFPSQGHSTSS